jgi:hypothetical protein
MRSAIAIVSAVATMTAQMPVGFAQNVTSITPQSAFSDSAHVITVSPIIVNAFEAFPDGGDRLRKRIAEAIVKDPKLAASLVKFVQTTPRLSKNQKLAAERGLADALNHLGIRAADIPVKVPPSAPPSAQANPELSDASWLSLFLLAGGIAGICLLTCRSEGQPRSVSSN